MTFASLGREFRLSLVLGALCLFLMLALGTELLVLNLEHDAVRKRLGKVGGAELTLESIKTSTFDLPEIETFGDLTERPLFQESRRPLALAQQPTEAPPEQPKTAMDLKLMGVVLSPRGMVALILDGQGKYKRALLGEPINGWHLKEIKSDRVSVEQLGETQELLLLKPRPKGITPPGGQPGAVPQRPVPGGVPGQPRVPPNVRGQPQVAVPPDGMVDDQAFEPDVEFDNEPINEE